MNRKSAAALVLVADSYLILIEFNSSFSYFLLKKTNYTERDSKIEISAVPKPRDSTIASHLIFLILDDLRSLNRESFRISPNPIF
jgi:hypothetical protein